MDVSVSNLEFIGRAEGVRVTLCGITPAGHGGRIDFMAAFGLRNLANFPALDGRIVPYLPRVLSLCLVVFFSLVL